MAGDGGVKLDHLPRFLVFINVLPYIMANLSLLQEPKTPLSSILITK